VNFAKADYEFAGNPKIPENCEEIIHADTPSGISFQMVLSLPIPHM
jgi:hypothetical protein